MTQYCVVRLTQGNMMGCTAIRVMDWLDYAQAIAFFEGEIDGATILATYPTYKQAAQAIQAH